VTFYYLLAFLLAAQTADKPHFGAAGPRGNIDSGGYSTPATARASAALQDAQLSVGCDPEVAPAYSLIREGRPAQAISFLLRATEAKPDETAPYRLLGKLVRIVPPDLLPDVQAKLKKWMDLRPSNVEAQTYYALTLERSVEAERLLRRAVEQGSTDSDAHQELGAIYAGRGDYPRAIAQYREVIRLRPGLADARYQLAQVYIKAGQPGLAKPEFDAFRRLRDAQQEQAPEACPGKQ
jgi:Flp pilus assembly protein TadD